MKNKAPINILHENNQFYNVKLEIIFKKNRNTQH